MARILLKNKHFILKLSLLFIILSDTQTDVRIQLYWDCTNSTLPSVVLESICFYPIISIDFPVVEIQITFVEKPQLKIIGFQT